MHIRGFENHNLTNRIIKWCLICAEFIVMWSLLYVVIGFIPRSDEWNDDMRHLFWTVGTLTMVLAQYWFPPVIHQRLKGAGDTLRRCTLLVITQVLLTYLLLRVFHTHYRLGWQLFFMGVGMWVILILLSFTERWMLNRLRMLGYNTRKVTFIGSDPEIHRLYQKLCCNATFGYKVRSSYVSSGEFAGLLSHPEDLHLGDEVYLCVPRKDRELIERTANLCRKEMIKFYYVPTAEEKLNLRLVLIDDIEVFEYEYKGEEEP